MKLNTGQISKALGFTVTRELLEDELGIAPVDKVKRAVYWDESQWPAICDRLGKHITEMGYFPPKLTDEPKSKGGESCDDLF